MDNGFLKRPETITFAQVITPEEAAHILATMKYEHQRPLRERKVREYAEAMVNGSFRELTQIFIAVYRGQYVYLDGQHRLHAVVRSGKPLRFAIVQQEVDSEEEMARIYSQTDRGIRRTPGDIYGAHALGEEIGLNKIMLDAFGAAIKFMASGCTAIATSSPPSSIEMIIPNMRLYAPYIQTYQDILKEGGASQSLNAQLKRTSTIAAALLTLRFSEPKAALAGLPSVRTFWLTTFRDDGLSRGDPRKIANQHLTFSRTMASRATDQRNIVTQAYSLRFLGRCFNAYLKGQSLQYVRGLDERAPVSIYGVPSDPARWW